jgi:hypothetical protein
MTSAQIYKFPDRAKRRMLSRRPRRSKNGTPEERAAKVATQPPKEVDAKRSASAKRPRRSKNGTPEERAAKRTAITAGGATIVYLATVPRQCRLKPDQAKAL